VHDGAAFFTCLFWYACNFYSRNAGLGIDENEPDKAEQGMVDYLEAGRVQRSGKGWNFFLPH
jgi:hypothetical protein